MKKAQLSSGGRAERGLEKLEGEGRRKKRKVRSEVTGRVREREKLSGNRPGRDSWLPHFCYLTVDTVAPNIRISPPRNLMCEEEKV